MSYSIFDGVSNGNLGSACFLTGIFFSEVSKHRARSEITTLLRIIIVLCYSCLKTEFVLSRCIFGRSKLYPAYRAYSTYIFYVSILYLYSRWLSVFKHFHLNYVANPFAPDRPVNRTVAKNIGIVNNNAISRCFVSWTDTSRSIRVIDLTL